MVKASRGFQVFAKPIGPVCNLACDYCYYVDKGSLIPKEKSFRMPEDLLETYIAQHIEASPDEIVRFSWHGGEPTLLGLDYFKRIVELQRKYKAHDVVIANGMQTNGTLLDEEWGRFLAEENLSVGLSLDGPREIHDRHRVTKNGRGSFDQTLRGYEILRRQEVSTDILCVVHAGNAEKPREVYRFFKKLEAPYITFLPLVAQGADEEEGVSVDTVRPDTWGDFLCSIFDEWTEQDIGRIKIQIFEEAARTAFGQEHSLCIFRPICGDIPVIEHDGSFYSCDHFVDDGHLLGNLRDTKLVELLQSPRQIAFGKAKEETLPGVCRSCEVLDMCNGECPKNRFLRAPDGGEGLNYLCAGYKRFFNHCRPWVNEVAAEWRRQQANVEQDALPSPVQSEKANVPPGRNAPCPCGSGKKYKKCCLGRR